MNCSICGKEIKPERVDKKGLGFNAMPINPGRCCKHCDDTVVTPRRIADATHEIRFSEGKIVGGRVVESNVRYLKKSDINKCPFLIFGPEHYRADGTCKCNDPEHRKMMKREWQYTDADFRRAGLIK